MLLFAVVVDQIDKAFEDISLVGMFRSHIVLYHRKMEIVLIDNRANDAFNHLLTVGFFRNSLEKQSEKLLNKIVFSIRKLFLSVCHWSVEGGRNGIIHGKMHEIG